MEPSSSCGSDGDGDSKTIEHPLIHGKSKKHRNRKNVTKRIVKSLCCCFFIDDRNNILPNRPASITDQQLPTNYNLNRRTSLNLALASESNRNLPLLPKTTEQQPHLQHVAYKSGKL